MPLELLVPGGGSELHVPEAADIWAFVVMVLEAFTERLPFFQLKNVAAAALFVTGGLPASEACRTFGGSWSMLERFWHPNPAQQLSIECWVRACSSSDATSAVFILRVVCERPGDLVLNTTPPLGDINNAKEFSDKANTFQNIGAAHPRYRFRQDHLIFLNTFTGVRNRSGWILPTAAKILVNVKQTEDAGTWSGQVEGSKERGMFLSSSVEPM
jgi:hypothetical protein